MAMTDSSITQMEIPMAAPEAIFATCAPLGPAAFDAMSATVPTIVRAKTPLTRPQIPPTSPRSMEATFITTMTSARTSKATSTL